MNRNAIDQQGGGRSPSKVTFPSACRKWAKLIYPLLPRDDQLFPESPLLTTIHCAGSPPTVPSFSHVSPQVDICQNIMMRILLTGASGYM
jgi:hypothetical protein